MRSWGHLRVILGGLGAVFGWCYSHARTDSTRASYLTNYHLPLPMWYMTLQDTNAVSLWRRMFVGIHRRSVCEFYVVCMVLGKFLAVFVRELLPEDPFMREILEGYNSDPCDCHIHRFQTPVARLPPMPRKEETRNALWIPLCSP